MVDPLAPAAPPAPKAFFITTPIYYVNDAPHIGHAYTTVAADILARWHRQRDERVWFLTGTDEHGQKVMRTAEQHGMSPQAWCDRLVEQDWKPVLRTIDASNDDFIRTTEPRHTERVQEFWARLHEAGQVYDGSYEGPYCVGCEEFKLPGELVDGQGDLAGQKLCPIHGRPIEIISEKNYFFRLGDYTQRLLDLYEANPDFVGPDSARNEVIAFVKGGLQDLSITRSTFDWGIRVPWDADHVLYVWIDALLNYVTAAGYGTDPDKFARTWPADLHLVGKDILRFHAVIWPAMLMAAGLEPPRRVFANGWLLVGGEKMSKSKATGIAPSLIIDHFGSDAFRYYFFRSIQYGADGSFSWEHMSAVYTSELANGLGNLASRVTAMVTKYFDGVLPPAPPGGQAERRVVALVADQARLADAAIDRTDITAAIIATKEVVDAVNAYLGEREPWKVAQDDARRDELATILVTAAEALRAVAVLYAPVMPVAAVALWHQLGAQEVLGPLGAQRIQDAGRWGQLTAGTRLTKGASLFPRLEDPADN